nr:Uncharacterised protein [Enterobacter ludwigii]
MNNMATESNAIHAAKKKKRLRPYKMLPGHDYMGVSVSYLIYKC